MSFLLDFLILRCLLDCDEFLGLLLWQLKLFIVIFHHLHHFLESFASWLGLSSMLHNDIESWLLDLFILRGLEYINQLILLWFLLARCNLVVVEGLLLNNLECVLLLFSDFEWLSMRKGIDNHGSDILVCLCLGDVDHCRLWESIHVLCHHLTKFLKCISVLLLLSSEVHWHSWLLCSNAWGEQLVEDLLWSFQVVISSGCKESV